jgi:hypothetical protein
MLESTARVRLMTNPAVMDALVSRRLRLADELNHDDGILSMTIDIASCVGFCVQMLEIEPMPHYSGEDMRPGVRRTVRWYSPAHIVVSLTGEMRITTAWITCCTLLLPLVSCLVSHLTAGPSQGR